MNILLISLNAKFIHSSLALRCLKAYASDFDKYIDICEFTINNEEGFILGEIYKKKPDIICFSCYIWNIEIIKRLTKNIKKVMPYITIILGGPEVSYDSYTILSKNSEIDIIIRGEGEETFKELADFYINNQTDLYSINGITFRTEENIILSNGDRSPLDMDKIPFVYTDLSSLENKIIYYESQRGCPYNCQFCLSSIEKGVRFLSEERVYSDLTFFLKNRVRQVKFVDRTFNCSKKHAMNIWNFLINNDNNYTNFHMEISAGLIDNDIIEVLSHARPGLFQFEIGVQSTNDITIETIERNIPFTKLKHFVNSINSLKNVHLHLDLIAGLPYEDYNSFKKSFNDVYRLNPEQLQLGFLKLLKGSGLRSNSDKYGIVFSDEAPYEVLFTKELSYEDILKLKSIEEMVETFFNSNKARTTIKYVINYFNSPFEFYELLSEFWESNGYDKSNHNKVSLYKYLLDFLTKQNGISDKINLIKELIVFDMLLIDNIRSFPDWMFNEEDENFKIKKREFYNNPENIKNYIPHLSGYKVSQIARMCNLKEFSYDFIPFINDDKDIEESSSIILFDYYLKSSINNQAFYYKISI